MSCRAAGEAGGARRVSAARGKDHGQVLSGRSQMLLKRLPLPEEVAGRAAAASQVWFQAGGSLSRLPGPACSLGCARHTLLPCRTDIRICPQVPVRFSSFQAALGPLSPPSLKISVLEQTAA